MLLLRWLGQAGTVSALVLALSCLEEGRLLACARSFTQDR